MNHNISLRNIPEEKHKDIIALSEYFKKQTTFSIYRVEDKIKEWNLWLVWEGTHKLEELARIVIMMTGANYNIKNQMYTINHD